jgi:hypothetical protein
VDGQLPLQLLDEASRHLAFIVSHMNEAGRRVVEVDVEAERAWSERIAELADLGLGGGLGGTDCTDYYNNEGRALEDRTSRPVRARLGRLLRTDGRLARGRRLRRSELSLRSLTRPRRSRP